MKKLACLLLTALSSVCFASGGDGFYYGPFPRDVPVTAMAEFTAGRLGVLDPTFQRAYRVAAWRALNGNPLNAAQTAQLMAAFADKQREGWDADPSNGNGESPWDAARKRYGDGTLTSQTVSLWGTRELSTELSGGRRRTVFYDNCTSSGTRTAARTLAERAQAYGNASANKWVAAWIAGQDQVFANCVDSQSKADAAPLPSAAPADAPAWFKQDRAYQVAAAHFYAGRFELARKAFEVVAKDPASPWAELAPYMAARSVLRQGSLAGGAERTKYLTQANAMFSAVESAGPVRYRKDAQAMLRRVAAELTPSLTLSRLAVEVGDGPWGADATAKLEDLIILLRQAASPSHDALSADRAQPVADGGLADWALEFGFASSVQPAGHDDYPYSDAATERAIRESTHACERAEHDAHRKAWTVLCYMKATEESSVPAAVSAFVGKLQAEDPAYATVTYHRARLRVQSLLWSNQPANPSAVVELRKVLDIELARGEAVYGIDGLNAMRVLRSTLSDSAADFLQYAQVQPLDEAARYGWLVPEARPVRNKRLEDYDNTQDLYPSLPVVRMAALARDGSLSTNWSDSLAGVAMVRAAKLGKLDLARDLAAFVKARQPRAGSELDEFIRAEDDVTRNYVLARFLGPADGRVAPSTTPQPFAWLSRTEQAEAAAQLETLRVAMQNYYARAVLDRAKQTPQDARLAVNLSEVVKGNRGELSKQAFDLLHKLFPKSAAAQRTKYWY